MERQPGVFDPLYRSMVEAGEGSGRLEEALDRVASQLEKLDALRRQVKSAMMYPAIVFSVAIVVMIAIVAFIVPVFVGIFEEISPENGESAELPLDDPDHRRGLRRGHRLVVHPDPGDRGAVAYVFVRWKKTERGRVASGTGSSCGSR